MINGRGTCPKCGSSSKRQGETNVDINWNYSGEPTTLVYGDKFICHSCSFAYVELSGRIWMCKEGEFL